MMKRRVIELDTDYDTIRLILIQELGNGSVSGTHHETDRLSHNQGQTATVRHTPSPHEEADSKAKHEAQSPV